MISLVQKYWLQKYWLLLCWFVTGIVLATLVSWGTAEPPLVTSQLNYTTLPNNPPEFLSSHTEPNFYQ
ncbi:hypothetical protein H6G76_08455 [Nostoc sp. FACHB-152]|uniref:hypothetical protein n=1 Tax=unclassified Nostoc TaxID=2593658 RepID=UPI001683AB64|nr:MULTISPECIES: hypothetical protein [unclassified Nostoc]MBD2447196.1 hypothetical protein [Nostoc sp. FACHB-152]MBD2471855.1 hypothetical protein [Nostoc sp. FACHB-145]